MSHQQNSRRAFLSNMAILSAGFSFAQSGISFSSLLNEKNIVQKWKHFWRLEGGILYDRKGSLINDQEIKACKGHFYKQGELIYFPSLDLFACATWIYWQSSSSTPADMFVAFYKKKNNCFEKIKCFSRFEMEAIYTTAEQIKHIPVLKDAVAGNVKTKIFVKNNVASHEIMYAKEQQIIFKHQFTYA